MLSLRLSNLFVDNLPHREERVVAPQLIYTCSRPRHRSASSGPLVPTLHVAPAFPVCKQRPVTLQGHGHRTKGRFEALLFLATLCVILVGRESRSQEALR